jgi:hypothetical protein
MVKTMINSNHFMLWLGWQMQTVALPIMDLVVTPDLNLLSPLIQEYQIIITVLVAEVELATAATP